MIWKFINKQIQIILIITTGITDCFLKFHIKFIFKFIFTLGFVKHLQLLIIIGTRIVLVGHDGGQRTVGKGEGNNADQHHDGCKGHFKQVGGGDVSIAHCGNCCDGPI